MAVYPNLAEQNTSNFFDLVKYANSVTSGWLGNIIVFLTFIVAFITMKRFETEKALTPSLFITLIITVLLRVLNLVGDWTITLVIIAFGLSVIWLYLRD